TRFKCDWSSDVCSSDLGSASVSSSTALAASGTVRIAVADQSGNLVSYKDLDLSSYATVGDLVTALNGISGVSASLDSSGYLSISATSSSNGIAINDMTSSVGGGDRKSTRLNSSHT